MIESIPQGRAKYPLEYFSAQIEFAHRISSITGASFLDTLSKYTGMYEALAGERSQEVPNEEAWEKLLRLMANKSPEEISNLAFTIYVEQNYADFDRSWTPVGTMRFGALGVGVTQYNLDRNQVKLHFLPTRKGGSDLASSRLSERREDMKRLLRFVRENYPDIQGIRSSTWLQNLPNYRALFPQSFLNRLTLMSNNFLGLWGQFVKWDGTANRERYDRFIGDLQGAKTLDEVIDSIPLKVCGATGPIQEFYDFYGVRL